MKTTAIRRYIELAPKAELHVHLEGSIQPETALELARRNGITLPATTPEGLREWFRFRDFDHFIEVYLAVSRCLRTREDYVFIVTEFARSMAAQNIRYAEVTFSPSTHAWLGVPKEVFLPGLSEGRRIARMEFGVEIRWVFDIVRNATDWEDWADYTVDVALEGLGEGGVIALGLGGKEEGFPPDRFGRMFDFARLEGLRSTPHAGEGLGASSVWGAIHDLQADRIGHGVRAIEDPLLIKHLRQAQITLEVCPTSNLRLGFYPSMKEHPLARLIEAGVSVTINTDDPALFNTTLADEIFLLVDPLGFGVEKVDEIILNSVRRSFLRKKEKALLMDEFAIGMLRAKAEAGLA